MLGLNTVCCKVTSRYRWFRAACHRWSFIAASWSPLLFFMHRYCGGDAGRNGSRVEVVAASGLAQWVCGVAAPFPPWLLLIDGCHCRRMCCGGGFGFSCKKIKKKRVEPLDPRDNIKKNNLEKLKQIYFLV